jgi:hypothetical protein
MITRLTPTRALIQGKKGPASNIEMKYEYLKPNRIIACLSLLCFLSVASYIAAAGRVEAASCQAPTAIQSQLQVRSINV